MIASRRVFLKQSLGLVALACPFLSSCKRRFVRPPGVYDLGLVTSLLFEKKHLLDKSMMVFRDKKGWSAMSTRCTFDGCDLSYQDLILYCPCCSSRYDHVGNKLSGKSPGPLPYFQIYYQDKHLYANSGQVVSRDYRFSTSDIESALQKLGLDKVIGDVRTPTRIPPILYGKGDGERGPMFRERDREDLEKPIVEVDR